MRQQPRRLVGDEVSGPDEPLAGLHEVGRELARVDAVLTPATDAVGDADHVGGIVRS